MRKSEYALWTLLVLAVLAAGSTMVGLARSQTASAANSEIYRQLDLFGEVLERVRADYVEKPEDAKLIESAINGMLMALDPHSAYLNPKHFRDMQVQTRGEFGGLGIEVTMENGVVKVVAPIEDTPASKAGIQSGDLITHLDKEQILGLTLQEAVEKMRGPVNSGDHAHHRAQGHRGSVRREGRARRDPHQSGEVQRRGRRRLYQGHHLQRADHGQSAEGDRGSEEADRPEAQGLCRRPAQQSRRPARSGDLGVRYVPRSGRHRADQGPQSRGDAARRTRGLATSPTGRRSSC